VTNPAPSSTPSGAAADHHAAPAASGSAPAVAVGHVRLGDDEVFTIRAPRRGKTAEQRAQAATAALASVVEHVHGADIRYERHLDVAVVLAGQTPIVELTAEDAQASGASSVDLHAASVVASLRSALEREHRQAALSKTVFSFSLIVFLGLIAFYLMRKIGEFAERGRAWIDAHAEDVLAVRVQQIEVVSPGTVRSTALVGLSVGHRLAQLGVFYAWLVFVLSLFDATSGYTDKLTGLIVAPLSQLTTRIATGLPVLAVLIIAGFAVFVLVRFLGLFFDSIERRENVVSWVTPELAAPTSALLRLGVVLAALVFLAPLVTGNPESPLARTGVVVVVALGLAATPVLASGMLGAILLFSRGLRTGQHVEIGAYGGRIASIGLLDLRLEDAERAEVRIPHLYSLRHPTRVLGLRPRFELELAVAPVVHHADVQGLLLRVATRFTDDARVELMSADSERTLFRVTFSSDQRNARSELQLGLLEALAGAQIPLGRLGRGAA
jgi:small-conductance mechanosensitive channel